MSDYECPVSNAITSRARRRRKGGAVLTPLWITLQWERQNLSSALSSS